MKRTTIDFGIDLGTTNSAIAMLDGVSSKIIKNNTDADITPSAVGYDKKGSLYTGQKAKNRAAEYDEDTYLEFKRLMGTDHVYRFKASGLTKKPEELSAEVLKELKGDVQNRLGETIEEAVITVPAAFELHQCDATRKAGQLAGFRECPLLQEPVAAALAYGFQADNRKAYWLVYDFGGGTFDAAILKSEEGIIDVVNHGGDNFLGGSDIDWAIVEQILIPKLLQDYELQDFKRGNHKWKRALAKLKWAAESAKIDLSRRDRTSLEAVKFMTDGGDEIEFDCDITQNELIRVAEPIIMRSVEICHRVLKEKNLSAQGLEKVILVGGPTKAPYFKQMLGDKLQVPLEFSVDPLTVVAQGAAVFAGTKRIGNTKPTQKVAGEFTVDLKYKPVGHDNEPMVGGKVAGAAGEDLSNYSLEFIQTKTKWSSGKISLKADGTFITNLFAEPKERNTYRIELTNSRGEKQKITPEEMTYTIGAVVEEQPLIHSIGVEKANRIVEFFFEKGQGLPRRKTQDFRTVYALRPGESGKLLHIPIVEGEHELADRNRLVGMLDIAATAIRRELPINSEVELTLAVDASRIIRAQAYVPLLDETYEAVVKLTGRANPTPAELAKECELEMGRMETLREKAQAVDGETNERALEQLEASNLMKDIKTSLTAAQGDPGAAAKCEKRLLELKVQLDELADAVELPALVAEAREWIGYVERVSERHGTAPQKQAAKKAIQETETAISEQKLPRLHRKMEDLKRVYYNIAMAQPGWWVNQLQLLEKQMDQMADPKRAERLLNQGQEYIAKNNVQGLENVVRELWNLLPDDVAEAAKQGRASGIL